MTEENKMKQNCIVEEKEIYKSKTPVHNIYRYIDPTNYSW